MPTPILPVRSFAELMDMPAHAQDKILYTLKYPDQAPGVFKARYYQSAVSAIRRYYSASNDKGVISDAIKVLANKIAAAPPRGRHMPANNARALRAFLSSPAASRVLEVYKNETWTGAVGPLQIRVAPDLVCCDGGVDRFLVFNLRKEPLPLDAARRILELSYHVLSQSESCSISQFELVDLATGASAVCKVPRKRTLTAATGTAGVIQRLWPTV